MCYLRFSREYEAIDVCKLFSLLPKFVQYSKRVFKSHGTVNGELNVRPLWQSQKLGAKKHARMLPKIFLLNLYVQLVFPQALVVLEPARPLERLYQKDYELYIQLFLKCIYLRRPIWVFMQKNFNGKTTNFLTKCNLHQLQSI